MTSLQLLAICYMLYAISVVRRTTLERETGFEPATASLEGWNSTTELLPQEFTLKNAHLRRQELIFELQRTTQYASAQILIPSLHLDIFERKLAIILCCLFEKNLNSRLSFAKLL